MPNVLSKRWPWLTVGAVTLLVWASTFVQVGPGDARPVGTAEDIARLSERNDVNLLFVLIDTLRADHLESYGYERATSPTLDALASKGVRFARHLAQCLEKVSRFLFSLPSLPDGNPLTAAGHGQERVHTQVGIASERFPALHTFEQKCIGLPGG